MDAPIGSHGSVRSGGGLTFSIEGDRAGYVNLLWDDMPIFGLADLHLEPPHRRRGLGRLILCYLIQLAIQEGASSIEGRMSPIDLAVVRGYGNSEALEVEFVAADGSTIALLTLTTRDVRPIRGRETLHVRVLA